MNRKIIAIIALLGLLFSIHLPTQAQTSDLIYLRTWNNEARTTNLWRYTVGASQAEPVYTFFPPRSIGELFSDHEIEMLQTEIIGVGEDKRFWQPGWENRLITPLIRDIEQLDQDHVLLLLGYEVRVAFAADNWESGLYGFHEFVIMDINHPENQVSLLKIDFHDAHYIQDWQGFFIPFVNIDISDINPTQPEFSLVLYPGGHIYDEPRLARSLLIVDYSAFPDVETELIPFAGYAHWSPDGTAFAYLQASAIDDQMHRLSLQIKMDTQETPFQVTSVIDRDNESLTLSDIGGMAWLDNQHLIFKWRTASSERHAIKMYDLAAHAVRLLPMADNFTYFELIEDAVGNPFILGYSTNDDYTYSAFLYSAQLPFSLVGEVQHIRPVSYDRRFPTELYLADPDYFDLTRLYISDAQIGQTVIELNHLLPEHESITQILPWHS